MSKLFLLNLMTFILLLNNLILEGQGLVINELMSSNDGFLLDEDGEDSDWIELYNNSSNTIDLSGYALSDNFDDLQQWIFPSMTIPAYSFLIVYASGKNRITPNSELHTNFKIKASGENIILSYQSNIIHVAPPIELATNLSYGLKEDGVEPFLIFNMPTPSASNQTSSGFATLYFNQQGGIFQETFDLTILSSDSTLNIYYTIDGTTPSASDFLYHTSLNLGQHLYSNANLNQIRVSPEDIYNPPLLEDVPKAIVIRAAAFDDLGQRASQVYTQTYFIKKLGIEHTIPVMAISVDHEALFDSINGIFVPGVHSEEENPNWTGNYYQRGIEWEKEVFIEYFENGTNQGFKQYAGLRTHGGNVRRFDQKGLKIYARSEYGKSEFEFPIFSDKHFDTYKRLVLKPISAAWTQANIQDFIANRLASTMEIDAIAIRPVVLYLNGEYWGIYNLQERIDNHYLAANFGANEDSIYNSWEYIGFYPALVNFIKDNDLSIEANYNIVSEWMNIENFIDYQLFQIFIANNDWPANNIKFWRPQEEGGQWRWIFYDGDAGFNPVYFDGFEQAINIDEENPFATLFLRKLLENHQFKENFLNRLDYLLDHQLKYENILPFYNEVLKVYDKELALQINRFAYPSDYSSWLNDIKKFENFILERPCVLRDLVEERFDYYLDVSSCELEEAYLEELSIFPNPNNGNFSLSFNLMENRVGVGLVLIKNALGQTITSKITSIGVGENIVQFEGLSLPQGIIFVSVIFENSIVVSKMVVN